MTQKKAIDLTGVDPAVGEKLQNVCEPQQNFAKGIAGDPLRESVPSLIRTSSEKVYANGHNAWIVLGRDRPKSRGSGYGGRGDTQAAAIDLVVGRMGSSPREFNPAGKRLWVNPDFTTDAARIYISQKSDIDEYFGLVKGKVGNSKTKSAVALKADGVRIIGREGIKLVTGTDLKNSQDAQLSSVVGIDLIAGNLDNDLQPFVKGENLREALKRLVHHVDKLNGIVDSILMTQMTFNEKLTHHFHYSPFFGLPTTPSIPVVIAGIKAMIDHLFQAKRSLVTHKTNLQLYRHTYYSPAGGKYINSRHNHVN